MITSPQQRLNNHLTVWDREIREHDAVVHQYGERKADLEYQRAVIKQTVMVRNEKLSAARAEIFADSNEEVHRLHKEFRAAEATIEAKKLRLRWCAAVADALRSEISTERAQSQLYANDRSTP